MQPVLLSQVVPSSQYHCGHDHHGHHHVQPVLLSRKKVSSTPGPTPWQVTMWASAHRPPLLRIVVGQSLVMVTVSPGLLPLRGPRRSSLLGKERSEDEGGEGKLGREREGKETTPEGSKFLTFSPPFLSNNNELESESESCPHNNTIHACTRFGVFGMLGACIWVR